MQIETRKHLVRFYLSNSIFCIYCTSYICSRRCPGFLLISLQMNHICTYICRLIFKSGRNFFLNISFHRKMSGSLFERLLLAPGVTRKCWNSFQLKFAMAQSLLHNSINISNIMQKNLFE